MHSESLLIQVRVGFGIFYPNPGNVRGDEITQSRHFVNNVFLDLQDAEDLQKVLAVFSELREKTWVRGAGNLTSCSVHNSLNFCTKLYCEHREAKLAFLLMLICESHRNCTANSLS